MSLFFLVHISLSSSPSDPPPLIHLHRCCCCCCCFSGLQRSGVLVHRLVWVKQTGSGVELWRTAVIAGWQASSAHGANWQGWDMYCTHTHTHAHYQETHTCSSNTAQQMAFRGRGWTYGHSRTYSTPQPQRDVITANSKNWFAVINKKRNKYISNVQTSEGVLILLLRAE